VSTSQNPSWDYWAEGQICARFAAVGMAVSDLRFVPNYDATDLNGQE